MSEVISYEICLQDVLDEKWAAYFAPFYVDRWSR